LPSELNQTLQELARRVQRSFEKSGVTFASLGSSVTDIKQTNIKTSFVIDMNTLFL